MLSLLLMCMLMMSLAVQAMDGRCATGSCQLPDCRCPGHDIPGGYKPEEVPQMVLITFDDAVNWDNWEFYLRLFPPEGNKRNPNGCPIGATFFVSHNFTDYCMVRKLHARMQEIADHSVTHRLPHAWWEKASQPQIAYEIVTQRKHLSELAEIPIEEIRGWRSPFLQPSGDNMFEVLFQNNFTYDATMTYPFPRNVYSPVMWPFTLDYSYTLVCNIQPCPKKTYPGFWIVPVVVMMDYREHLPCAYVDHCTNEPRDHDETFDMLWKNFLRNYRTNRAPVYVNLHSKWLETDFHLDAMDEFIQRLTSMNDVYVLPVHKALEWVMNPTPIGALEEFEPWQCPGFKPNQEDDEFCSFTFRPRTTTTTTFRSSTTPHSQYHQTHYDDRDDYYDDYDSGRDHNGVPRGGGRGKGRDRASHGNMHRGHRNHAAHRPWFLRGGAGSNTGDAVFVVLCGVSLMLAVVRT